MKQARILFIINGLGLGNSTRCAAIIEQLAKLGYQIDIMTSGNGLLYFSSNQNKSELFSLKAFRYGSSSGKLSAIKTFLLIPQFFVNFIQNQNNLKRVLKQHEYTAIVFDSDYTTFGLSRTERPKLIAINNAAFVVEKIRSLEKVPRNILLQFWIEKVDCWFHKVVPDLVICPTFSELLIQQENLKCVSPFIRSELRIKTNKRSKKKILVMLSGSQFGSSTAFLDQLPQLENVQIDVVGKSGISKGNIQFHGKVLENHDLINSADALVINAGFSAVSEALLLKIPAVIIPIANHAEQFINAHAFENLGFGLIADQENAGQKMLQLLQNIEQYQKAFEKAETVTDSSQKIAKIIDQFIKPHSSVL